MALGRIVMAVSVLATLAVPRPAAAQCFPPGGPGPILSQCKEFYAQQLTCPLEPFGAPQQPVGEPVLLVHGMFADEVETWTWNHANALAADGRLVCAVRLPNRALSDIQYTTEFVVAALRIMRDDLGHSRIDVVGHNEGGLQPRWGILFWPDMRETVDDLVMLGTPNHGTGTGVHVSNNKALERAVAEQTGCFRACWQMLEGSRFLARLNLDPSPGTVSYTSIYSETDVIVQPSFGSTASARLPSASNVSNVPIQSVCPARYVDQAGFLTDAAVYALALDALAQPGPADPSRVGTAACSERFHHGVDVAEMTQQAVLAALLFGPPDSFSHASSEPELRDYAQ